MMLIVFPLDCISSGLMLTNNNSFSGKEFQIIQHPSDTCEFFTCEFFKNSRPGQCQPGLAPKTIPSMVPEQRQNDDDRERNSQQPKQQASTETHGNLHCVLSRCVSI
jgi:hypothetical protein